MLRPFCNDGENEGAEDNFLRFKMKSFRFYTRYNRLECSNIVNHAPGQHNADADLNETRMTKMPSYSIPFGDRLQVTHLAYPMTAVNYSILRTQTM